MSDPLTSDDLALLSALSPGANVRQASLALGLPRSTLSRHLAELEARLGRSLFLRRGRALTPTRYGEEVMRCAAKAHAAWHELRAAASADSERFVLAAAPLFAEHVVPALLSHLLAEQSTLRVELLLSHRFEDIFSERIDLALRRGPLASSDSLAARRLGRLTMMCVAAPSLHVPLTTSAADRAAALPWIRVGTRADPFSLTLMNGRRRQSVRVSPRVAVDNQRIALELARRGVGVARVNAFLAREALSAGHLREILPEARSSEDAFAVYPRRARGGDLVARVLRRLEEVKHEVTIWD